MSGYAEPAGYIESLRDQWRDAVADEATVLGFDDWIEAEAERQHERNLDRPTARERHVDAFEARP